MSQAFKTHARQGRGAGNGYNENWRNSPLWDSFEKKKKEQQLEVTEVQKTLAVSKEESKEETLKETLKEKQKRMFAMVY